MDISVAAMLDAAGRSPVLQGMAIIAGTFLLEDAATVLAAMQVETGTITLPVGLISLYLGIILGDLGLYGLGRLAATFGWAQRLIPPQRQDRGRRWLEHRVFQVVFVSRFLPGARLPTYTTCGFLGADLRRFALAVVLATSIWTTALFGVSMRVGHLLMEHFGAWRWAGAIGFAIVIVLAGRLVARVQETTK